MGNGTKPRPKNKNVALGENRRSRGEMKDEVAKEPKKRLAGLPQMMRFKLLLLTICVSLVRDIKHAWKKKENRAKHLEDRMKKIDH